MALEPAGVKLVAENASGFQSAIGAAGKAVTGFVGLVAGAAIGIGTGLAAGLGVAATAGLGFNKSLEDASARIQAFTKDSAQTAAILEMVKQRAAETPFAFEEMATAAASLGPAAKSAGVPLEELIAQAEILAASNPAEGLAGAAFAIREAASGDFTSAIERFNLSRQVINQLKEEGVPALEILSQAMLKAGYDADLVANLANTAGGRLSTFTDTFTNLAGIATNPIFDAFSAGLGEVNKILADNAPLLNEAAEGLAQILAPAAQALGGIMRGAAEGLVQFAKNLPSIAQQAGQVAGVLMAVIDTAKQWWAALSPLLSQAFQWGANFIGQLAKGMLDAASAVVGVLMQIGSIIAGWLAPGSPPKLLPDLPDWGQSAVNQFMAGWANPDLSAFDTLAGTIEQMLRDLVPTGQTDEGGVLSMIFGSRDAIARAVEEFRTLGTVSEDAFGAIRDAAGPAGESAEKFARAYFEVEEASREVAKAQEDVENATRAVDDAQKALNDTLSAFDAILNPLNKQLQGIQDRKQEIQDAQRIAELQEELASGKLDEADAELARLEIAEIQTEQQIRNAEAEKDAAAESAEANVTAAEEAKVAAEGRLEAAEAAEAAAQAQLEREVAAIGLQSEQNRLIGEQIALLEKLAKAATAGGAGGGAGGLPGLPSLDDLDQGGAGKGKGKAGAKKNPIVEAFKQAIEDAKAETQKAIDDWLADIRERFANFGKGGGPDLGAWVQQALPGLQAGLQQAAEALGIWVATQAPVWGEQLATMGQRLGGFVMEALPGLITALADARTALVSWVLDSLPGWAAELDKLRTAMIDWVAASLPDLGTNLGKITALLIAKTGEFIAEVGPKLLELGAQFVGWVVTVALPRLPGEMAKIGGALLTGIGNFLDEIVPEIDKLGLMLVNWVAEKVLPALPGKIAEIGSTIITGMQGFTEELGREAAAVGMSIVDGVADGIRSAAGRAIQAAKDLASSLPEWVRKVLGIASPSKVMAALGLNAGDSFAGGILDAIPAAIKAAEGLAEEMRDKVMKELERVAKDVQKFMQERLSGRIGLARGAIGGIDVLKDAQRTLRELEREQIEAGNEVAAFQEEQARRRQENEEAAAAVAHEVNDLMLERRIAEQTAAQNIDPETRAEAEQRILEIDQEIADVLAASDEARRQAIAEDVAAAAELTEMEKERAEIARQITIAAERERYIREQMIKAQAEAAEIAKTDPLLAQQFLQLRQSQIAEMAALQAELTTETDDQTRRLIQDQIKLLEAAQALEAEQFRQQAEERTAAIAGLGSPQLTGEAAADEFLKGLRLTVEGGGAEIAQALLGSIYGALTSGLMAALPYTPPFVTSQASAGAGAGMASATYGDQNVSIQAGGFTVAQLEGVVRKVLSEQARAAGNTARGV